MEFSGILLINVLSYEIYRFTCLQKYLSRKKLCHCHCSILLLQVQDTPVLWEHQLLKNLVLLLVLQWDGARVILLG